MPGAPSSFLLLLVMPGAFHVLSLSFLGTCRWFTTFFLFCADTGSRPELEALKPHYWRFPSTLIHASYFGGSEYVYICVMLVCLKIPSTTFNARLLSLDPQSMMQTYVAVCQDKKWTLQRGMQKDAK